MVWLSVPYVLLSKNSCFSGRKEKGWKGGLRHNSERLMGLCTMLFQLLFCYSYEGIVFHIIWNTIPDDMERDSSLYGTGFQLRNNSAINEKARYGG